MIYIPMMPNSVNIPLIQVGCLKRKFDSTYPIHLNGIISQVDFHESIKRINRAISSNKIVIILAILSSLCAIVGIICIVAGGITVSNSVRFGFPILIGIGIAIFTFGILSFSIGCCIIESRLLRRVQRVITEESMKYSSRTFKPCSWRLERVENLVLGTNQSIRSQDDYQLVIDISQPAIAINTTHHLNQIAPESALSFQQQNNSDPPPYSNQHIQLCSQCNTQQQDINAKFCSACGHSFQKY